MHIKYLIFRKDNAFFIFFSLIQNSIRYFIWRIYKKIKRIDQPVIHIHSICWNEDRIISHYVNHYSRFVSHFYIYDNYSDDNTDNILKELKNVTIIKFDTNNAFDVEANTNIKNKAWKKSIGKADWVIVCDLDEFLYFEGEILDYLKRTKASIFRLKGYDMYSGHFPNEKDLLIDQIKYGVYFEPYNKAILFNPYKIIKINYSQGAHTTNPCGIVRFNDGTFKLLHYKNLNFEYLMDRIRIYRKRYSQTGIAKGYGIHYRYEDEKIKKDFDINLENSIKIIN